APAGESRDLRPVHTIPNTGSGFVLASNGRLLFTLSPSDKKLDVRWFDNSDRIQGPVSRQLPAPPTEIDVTAGAKKLLVTSLPDNVNGWVVPISLSDQKVEPELRIPGPILDVTSAGGGPMKGQAVVTALTRSAAGGGPVGRLYLVNLSGIGV